MSDRSRVRAALVECLRALDKLPDRGGEIFLAPLYEQLEDALHDLDAEAQS